MLAGKFSKAPSLENVTKAGGGVSNAGIYCYTVRRTFAERRFVEKRTNNGREVRVARLLLERSKLRPSLFPKIYRVVDGREHTSILMEYIDGVGAMPTLGAPVAAAVTRAIVKLQRMFHGADLERVPVSVARLVQSLEQSEIDRDTREPIIKALEQNAQAYNACRRITCHSDLFWPNLSVRGWRSVPYCRLVDVGYVGSNMLGSDLHHFFRSAVRVPAERDFYRRLVNLTADAFNVDAKNVDLAARYYALFRSASTIRRRLESGNVAGARLEAEFSLRMERRFG